MHLLTLAIDASNGQMYFFSAPSSFTPLAVMRDQQVLRNPADAIMVAPPTVASEPSCTDLLAEGRIYFFSGLGSPLIRHNIYHQAPGKPPDFRIVDLPPDARVVVFCMHGLIPCRYQPTAARSKPHTS